MRKFMDEEFLLTTETAQRLYHSYAEPQPIIDYHCHISPKEIYQDRQFENITQIWLGEDHYKWRQMRSNGVEERCITGEASDWEKFYAWAGTLEKAIGNPLYHWSHLELKRYFGYEGHLCRETAQQVWELCNEKLQQPEMSARNLIRQSHVTVICTTDDPIDSLEWHQRIREDSFEVKVLPAWRPDKAMNIEKPGYLGYLAELEAVCGYRIDRFSTLIDALLQRMDYFAENGCKIADHGLAYIMYEPADAEELELLFAKRLAGEQLSEKEERQYKTAFMLEMGRGAARHGWVMQMHYGVQRDLNRRIFEQLGPDAGIDAISTYSSAIEMGQFLNALDYTNELPKMILYSLNPTDNAVIESVMGCFQGEEAAGKLQHGSAWWFNDHKAGMTAQLTSLANLGLLGNFIGMLTDSRSFLSYTRHEYFRRILCELIGGWVENGEYPEDDRLLADIIRGISYENAERYFNFREKE